MKNNETCNAPKCLKPSGLIDWINCRLCNGWVYTKCAKKPKRDRKPQQKSELDRRLRSICTKLDEGNVKAGIRMAVGDDKCWRQSNARSES